MSPLKAALSAVLLILALVAGLGATVGCAAATGASGGEIRGVWMHPDYQFSADPSTGRQQVREFVDRVVTANFNMIFAWVKSEYFAALEDERYVGHSPIAKWDAIGEMTRVARERGAQIHLWYSFTYYKSPNSPEFDPKHGGSPAWAAMRIDELIPEKTTGKVVPRRMADVSPIHPEARDWELRLLDQAVQRYPLLSGFHIEEPGYGYPGNDVSDKFLQVFKSIYGSDATRGVDGAEAEDLKSLATTAFIRALREQLVRRNPQLMLSVNGGYSWRRDRSLGRDWEHWARMGWLDFYVAQIYTTDLALFRERARAIQSDLAGLCPVVLGVGVEWTGSRNTPEIATKQVEAARDLAVGGVAIYHGKALSENYLMALRSGPFRQPASVPTPKR